MSTEHENDEAFSTNFNASISDPDDQENTIECLMQDVIQSRIALQEPGRVSLDEVKKMLSELPEDDVMKQNE